MARRRYSLSRPPYSRVKRYGPAVGGAVGLFSVAVALVQGLPASVAGKMSVSIWALALVLLSGWGIFRLYATTFPGSGTARVDAASGTESVAATADMPPPAEAHAISRRRFVIQMGGLVATIIVAGSGVGAILRAQESSEAPGPGTGPVVLPNAHSPVQPVPGTRPEYTAVADHFRMDIDLTLPQIDVTTWRLTVDGLVTTPLALTLDQIKSDYKRVEQFVTLSCISNIVGGPFIGTTLWTGVPFRDVLAQARPGAGARYAHIKSVDGFDEKVDLELVNSDPRIILAYAWDRQPLPLAHGFPLRIYIPDRYGMKQPRWITSVTLTADSTPGYWVADGWDERAEIKTTSVIDTVATKSLVTRDGRTYVPIGGIAHAGAKGVSKVEIQIDDNPWEAAELRKPLSKLTWVIWRYDWPFTEGTHRLAVRAYDGQGRVQETQDHEAFPSGATGIYTEQRTIEPISP